jgi:hypothetical protein
MMRKCRPVGSSWRMMGKYFRTNACAIALSTLLQDGGINVLDIYQAITLGRELGDKRNWQTIPVGQHQAGDIGSTCGDQPHHGRDHIYVVLKKVDDDEMLIADNQQSQPHSRFVSGQGRTPTKFFLRAT